ncbi:MAG: hypothetical protein SGI83_15870 [Bacteroidota bacterium]|nr:hypothetical protein [Bacteroidota bacterium]
MKKILTAGSVMLLCLFAHSQKHENRMLHTEAETKVVVIQIRPVQSALPFSFPSGDLIQESHQGTRLYSAGNTDGKLHGNWQSWYANGLLCDSGRLIKNIPEGEWKYWDEHGQLIAIRHYSAVKFHQVLEEMHRYNPKRSFYILSLLYQQNRSGALQYLDVSYSFPGSKTASDYATLRELVLSNIFGQSYKPVFEQCLQDGLYMNYFADGSIKDSGDYKDGLRHGPWIHMKGAALYRQQGAYQNGLKVKEWKIYDRNNKLLELIFYNKSGQESWRKKMNRLED